MGFTFWEQRVYGLLKVDFFTNWNLNYNLLVALWCSLGKYAKHRGDSILNLDLFYKVNAYMHNWFTTIGLLRNLLFIILTGNIAENPAHVDLWLTADKSTKSDDQGPFY